MTETCEGDRAGGVDRSAPPFHRIAEEDIHDVRSAHAAFRAWLFDHALPFWAGPGHDGTAAREHLRLDGSPADVGFTRMRVQARQIYVFSQAALLGWPQGEALARRGHDFISRRGERPQGGWARRLSPAGEVLDDAIDLYDQAFVLFALAWLHRLTGAPEVAAQARRTTDWITGHMRAPHGGFHNVIPVDDAPRQQNPHMHLLEAMLALHESTGEPAYVAVAHELAALFKRHLLDPATGTLGEFFAPDWSPAAGAAGDHVEPGHHYEWVWLLDRYERLTGASATTEIERLYRFAVRHGADPRNGLVIDVVGRDGAVRQASARLWPQTEALKAHAVMARRGEAGADARATQAARNLLTRFFRGGPAGAWTDQLDARGEATADKIPTSSFYHVMMGFTELDRLAADRG